MSFIDNYVALGKIIGALSGVVAFFGSYYYCIATYGYLLGFGLGWLPSLILGVIVMFFATLLWPIVIAGVAVGLYDATEALKVIK